MQNSNHWSHCGLADAYTTRPRRPPTRTKLLLCWIVVFLSVNSIGFQIFFAGRKEVEDVKHDFDLLIHYMDHEYKFNVHKAITNGHNKQLAV